MNENHKAVIKESVDIEVSHIYVGDKTRKEVLKALILNKLKNADINILRR